MEKEFNNLLCGSFDKNDLSKLPKIEELDKESKNFVVKFSLAFFDFIEDVEKSVVKARGVESAEFEKRYLDAVRSLYAITFEPLVMPYVKELLEDNYNVTI